MPVKHVTTVLELAKSLSKRIDVPELDLVAIITGVTEEIAKRAKKGEAIQLPPLGYVHYSVVSRRHVENGRGTFLISLYPPKIKEPK